MRGLNSFFFPLSILCLVKYSKMSAGSLGPADAPSSKSRIKLSAWESESITNPGEPRSNRSSSRTNPEYCYFFSLQSSGRQTGHVRAW